MRIERHQVDGADVSAAIEDFANRIGGQVRSMSKAGRTATYEWQSTADEFLGHLGALSVETPGLDATIDRNVLKELPGAGNGSFGEGDRIGERYRGAGAGQAVLAQRFVGIEPGLRRRPGAEVLRACAHQAHCPQPS